MAYDFLLDDDAKDLVISKGKFGFTQSVRETLRQRMYITFRTVRGEWFLNAAFGAYDVEAFSNKELTKNALDSYFISLINSFPEVELLRSFEATYDPFTRTYGMIFSVDTVEGTGVFRIDLTPPDVEVAYPDPSSIFDLDACEIPDVDRTNTYYEYLNITLATDQRWL